MNSCTIIAFKLRQGVANHGVMPNIPILSPNDHHMSRKRLFRILPAFLIIGFLLAGISPAEAVPPIRIMPLGDSITNGSSSGVVPDNSSYYISYRKALRDSLVSAGYEIDYVGSQTSGEAVFSDAQHEGHGGWTNLRYRRPYLRLAAGQPGRHHPAAHRNERPPTSPERRRRSFWTKSTATKEITVYPSPYSWRASSTARIICSATTEFNDM